MSAKGIRIGSISFCMISLWMISCDASTSHHPAEQPHSSGKELLNGIGNFSDLILSEPIDSNLVQKGKVIYQEKCAACHTLNKETLVGPGWLGATEKYKASWLVNFMTNTNQMLDKDDQAKELLEIYSLRMPDQGLKDDQARNVLEFMRYIDRK